MNILHVTSRYPPSKGGVEQVVSRLAEIQSQSGHEVTVITTRHSEAGYTTARKDCGVKVIPLPHIDVSGYVIAPLMAYHIARTSADIVHFHGFASAGSLMGSMVHCGNKVCTAYFHPVETYTHRNFVRLATWLATRQSSTYRTIIALTRREQVLLERITKHRRTIVVPSGIDPASLPHGDTGYMRDRDLVLFVGRIAANKGLPTLIQAIDLVALQKPAVRLVVVGKDCGELARARRVAQKLGKRVEFRGEVSDEVLHTLLRTARLTVLPSKYESFGLVVLESLARGTPVVVSNGVALAEEVTDAGCGIAFPYGDVREMAECIVRMTSCCGEWRSMSERGLEFVRAYAWDKVAARVLEVYAEAIAQG